MTSDALPVHYSARFQRIVALIVDVEGGYWVDPRGGPTNKGISQKAYPNEDIENMSTERAVFLYHRDYWLPVGGDDLPEGIDIIVFDTAVNQGLGTSIRMMQTVVGVSVDGRVGPITLGAVGRLNFLDFLVEFGALRALRYAHTLGLEENGHGWYRRMLGFCVYVAANRIH